MLDFGGVYVRFLCTHMLFVNMPDALNICINWTWFLLILLMATRNQAFTQKTGNWKDIFLSSVRKTMFWTLARRSCCIHAKLQLGPNMPKCFLMYIASNPRASPVRNMGASMAIFSSHGIKKGTFVEPCRAEPLRKLKAWNILTNFACGKCLLWFRVWVSLCRVSHVYVIYVAFWVSKCQNIRKWNNWNKARCRFLLVEVRQQYLCKALHVEKSCRSALTALPLNGIYSPELGRLTFTSTRCSIKLSGPKHYTECPRVHWVGVTWLICEQLPWRHYARDVEVPTPAYGLDCWALLLLCDPGFYQARTVISTFHRLLDKQPALLRLWADYMTSWHGSDTQGPFGKLLEITRQIGWSINVPCLCDHDGVRWDITHCDLALLRKAVSDAWVQRLAADVAKRSDFAGLAGIDHEVLKRAQSRLLPADRAWLSTLRDGTFVEPKQQAKYDLSKSTLCPHCNQPDSVYHRTFVCPAFAALRDPFHDVVSLATTMPTSLCATPTKSQSTSWPVPPGTLPAIRRGWDYCYPPYGRAHPPLHGRVLQASGHSSLFTGSVLRCQCNPWPRHCVRYLRGSDPN